MRSRTAFKLAERSGRASRHARAGRMEGSGNMSSRSVSSVRRALLAAALAAVALACALLPAGRAFAEGCSITIEDAAEGEYYLYKLFDGTYATDDDGNTVMGEAVLNDDVEDVVVTVLADRGVTVEGYAYDDDGAYEGEDGSYTDVARANNLMDAIAALDDEQAFADALAEALLADSGVTPEATATGDGASVTFSDLETGYYLVVEVPTEGANAETGAILVLLSESTIVRTKTGVPTPVIEVFEDSTQTWGDAADAQAGEAVPYRITATLPSDWAYLKSYYYCIVNPQDAGLELDTSTIAVTLLDGDGEELADLTGYATITYEDNTLTVLFDDLVAAVEGAGATATADCTVQVTYEASLVPTGDGSAASTVTADCASAFAAALVRTAGGTASSTVETGIDGAKENSVHLVYGGDRETSVEDEAVLYTWALELVKTGEDTDGALEGAVFTIQAEDGSYVAADGSLTDEAVELTTGANGTVSVSGLDSGTYTVTETEAPEGYDAVDAFTVDIASELGDEVTLTATARSSDVASVDVDVQTGVITLDVVDGLTLLGGSSGSSSGLWGGLVQTGDSPWVLAVAALVVVGVVAVVVGLRLRRRSSGSDE